MQVNMLEAKNQLSRLVKAALAGEEVIIASNGKAQVRLVPCATSPGLRAWGSLAGQYTDTDQAFSNDAHAIEAARLPGIHEDPFDRLIIAQARIEGLMAVSSDSRWSHYSIALHRP